MSAAAGYSVDEAPTAKKGQEVADVAMDVDYHLKTAKMQKETLGKSFAVCFEQMKTIKLPEGSTAACIVDLGCADGINSIPLFKGCVNEIRKKDEDKAIVLVFEDQPCNDYTLIPKMDSFGPKCFPMISSIGFFDPTVAPGTVQLAFTSHAMHYLSGGPPCNFKGSAIHHTDASAAENAIFAAAAAKDWEKLLLARASELAVGGRAVLSNLCIDETKGWFHFHTDRGPSVYTQIAACMKSLADDGLITELELEYATSPEYYRTVKEHKLPFEDPEGAVRKAGLVLKSAELQNCRCPYRADYESGAYSSAKEYGEEIASLATAFSYHKCMRAFKNPQNTRSEAEQRKLIDEVYVRFAKRIEAAPLAFCTDQVCLILIIEKVR